MTEKQTGQHFRILAPTLYTEARYFCTLQPNQTKTKLNTTQQNKERRTEIYPNLLPSVFDQEKWDRKDVSTCSASPCSPPWCSSLVQDLTQLIIATDMLLLLTQLHQRFMWVACNPQAAPLRYLHPVVQRSAPPIAQTSLSSVRPYLKASCLRRPCSPLGLKSLSKELSFAPRGKWLWKLELMTSSLNGRKPLMQERNLGTSMPGMAITLALYIASRLAIHWRW